MSVFFTKLLVLILLYHYALEFIVLYLLGMFFAFPDIVNLLLLVQISYLIFR